MRAKNKNLNNNTYVNSRRHHLTYFLFAFMINVLFTKHCADLLCFWCGGGHTAANTHMGHDVFVPNVFDRKQCVTLKRWFSETFRHDGSSSPTRLTMAHFKVHHNESKILRLTFFVCQPPSTFKQTLLIPRHSTTATSSGG